MTAITGSESANFAEADSSPATRWVFPTAQQTEVPDAKPLAGTTGTSQNHGKEMTLTLVNATGWLETSKAIAP